MSKQTEDFPEKKQWAGYDQGTDARTLSCSPILCGICNLTGKRKSAGSEGQVL